MRRLEVLKLREMGALSFFVGQRRCFRDFGEVGVQCRGANDLLPSLADGHHVVTNLLDQLFNLHVIPSGV
jgi:hypothetical protein